MNLLRSSFFRLLLLLSLCIVHGRAADPAVSDDAEEAWKQYQALWGNLGPMPAPYRNLMAMPPLEREKFVEARGRRVAEFALSYYAKHPQDPRRWIVVDNFIFASSPRFVTDWAPDAAGKSHPVVDEAAAAAWQSTVADLRAAFEKATDVPQDVRENYQKRESRMASMRKFRTRWKADDHPTAPEFSFMDSDGHEKTLADLRGKVVILDFWATWCGPCMEAMPHNQEIAARFKDQGVVVLGVCVWDREDKFNPWVKQNQAKFPDIAWGFDPAGVTDRSVARRLYDVPAIPAEFVIDRDGRVVEAFLGFGEDGMTAMEKALAKAGIRIEPKS